MELLESQDPEKKKLIETSERHRRELEKEVSDITAKTEKMVTNALIIGGALALTYFVVSGLSGRSKKKKHKKLKVKPAQVITDDDDLDEDDDEEEATASFGSLIAPSLVAQIGTRVINQATMMLLDIARGKLTEYLTAPKSKDENS